TLSGELIVAHPNGQSYISGYDGAEIRDIRIELANGDPFTSLILAVNLPGTGHAAACYGCVAYSAAGSAAGSGKLPGALGPGTSFFTFVAPPGEEITSLT